LRGERGEGRKEKGEGRRGKGEGRSHIKLNLYFDEKKG
jgi:hypothetical protein